MQVETIIEIIIQMMQIEILIWVFLLVLQIEEGKIMLVWELLQIIVKILMF